jgi:hypothetical protein
VAGTKPGAERMVGTFRRECLDHLIVVDERQLQCLLREFVAYYNRDRSHRSLVLRTPAGIVGSPASSFAGRSSAVSITAMNGPLDRRAFCRPTAWPLVSPSPQS